MAIKQTDLENSYKNTLNTEEEINPGLERATNALGTKEGTELYNNAEATVIADRIISNKKHLDNSSMETYNKKMNKLASTALTLSKEYNDKKTNIDNDMNLSVEGKTNSLNELYKDYNKQVKQIIKEQATLRKEHNVTRAKIADETLILLEKEASINDFTDKDMQYLTYIIPIASNDILLNVLEQYDFNPFLINMINARDSKVKTHTKEGKLNTDKLTVVHPLAYIKAHREIINANELYTNIGTRYLHELIPTDGIPQLDPWANITETKKAAW